MGVNDITEGRSIRGSDQHIVEEIWMRQIIEVDTLDFDRVYRFTLRYGDRKMSVNIQKEAWMPKHINELIKSTTQKLIQGMHEEEVEKAIRVKLAKMSLLDQIKL